MQASEDSGCLSQRSQLGRLRELADGIARERVGALAPTSTAFPTVLLVIGPQGRDASWDLDHLHGSAASLGRADAPTLNLQGTLANLVPTHLIMRLLRESSATAAGLIAPLTSSMVALQLADVDHEESLTASVTHQADAPALGKWDFATVLWPVRLRQMLLGAQRARPEEPAWVSPAATNATPPAPPPVSAAASKADPVAVGRRGQRREMREQLHREAAAAPSWLQ